MSSTEMTSWYEMLKEQLELDGEDFDKLICTMDEEEARKSFPAWGYFDERPWTAWGENWVYFPLLYDGVMSVGHAPRNPGKIEMEAQ